MAPDLAESIVALGKASQQRRQSRRSLIESTAVVAESIRKHLRRGDEVRIPPQLAATPVGGPGARGPAYRVVRVVEPSKSALMLGGKNFIDVLARDWAVLNDIKGREDEDFDGMLASPDSPSSTFSMATDEQRIAFAKEAPAVVEAFRELLSKQAEENATAAVENTKLRIR